MFTPDAAARERCAKILGSYELLAWWSVVNNEVCVCVESVV